MQPDPRIQTFGPFCSRPAFPPFSLNDERDMRPGLRAMLGLTKLELVAAVLLAGEGVSMPETMNLVHEHEYICRAVELAAKLLAQCATYEKHYLSVMEKIHAEDTTRSKRKQP